MNSKHVDTMYLKKHRYIFFSLKTFVQFKTQKIAGLKISFIFYGNTSVDCQGGWMGTGQNWAIFLTTDLLVITAKFWAREHDYIVIFEKYKAY